MKRRTLLAGLSVLGSKRVEAQQPHRVGAALPDPPFEFMSNGNPRGFDIALMQRVAEQLDRTWELCPYEGSDFNGIFAGLNTGLYDCIASGATVTPERERIADFCDPYVISGQSLVVDVKRHPDVHGIGDLKGLVIGVQQGNTSQPVANGLVAEGRAARVRVYPYDQIEQALSDLSRGGCDVFMKLAPVLDWLVRDRPHLKVVETGITVERLAVCVRKGDARLRDAINRAQSTLFQDGRLQSLIGQWLGSAARIP